MSPELIGLLAMIALLILFLLRMPVAVALLVVGVFGIAAIRDWNASFAQLAISPFNTATSFSLSVIPLFIFMGMILSNSGFGQDLYRAVDAWIGKMRGGLAMTTIGTSALFSCISGSVNATTATMARICLPEMRKYNYDPGLSTACVAAGGTLGILIPPSVILILYGVLTMETVGSLLIAGIVPGILQIFLFMATVYLLVRRNPALAPIGEAKPFSVKLRSLGMVWPFAALFLLSIGGIYIGIFTPTEAGAIGAFGAFVIALFTKRLSWSHFTSALSDTTRLTAMIFFILIGADVFSKMLAMSGIPTALTSYVGGLDLSPYVILIFILIAYFILGLFLEGIAIFVLTLPVTYPLIIELGFDGVWFGVIMILVMNIGLVTPPLGISVYIISGVAKDIPIQKIFRAMVPMIIAMLVCVVLLVMFPQLATWLPELMRGS
ncbi:TRAP transporter large permease [Bacillus sp. Marseille-P3800]|uniref:TRAP transporter large permease n=1 Tax=Bacillus sp. Marseille-P3800 TaxID=2014782 RepID=UPI000C0849DD|nr:TRAP transporter large permease [Bacillus sp. Marseille-P3800]